MAVHLRLRRPTVGLKIGQVWVDAVLGAGGVAVDIGGVLAERRLFGRNPGVIQ